jgi:hypothetical protein
MSPVNLDEAFRHDRQNVCYEIVLELWVITNNTLRALETFTSD